MTLSYALGVEEAWPVAAQLLLALAPRMVRIGFWSEWLPYLEQGPDAEPGSARPR